MSLLDYINRFDFSNLLKELKSPLNIFLLVILAYLVYSVFIKSTNDYLQVGINPDKILEPLNFKNYSLSELSKYNGIDQKDRVLIAIKNKVFDVSSGTSFYGPGGPYELFAGNDASIALAKNSFEKDLLNKYSPDAFKELSNDEKETLNEWLVHFENKYPLVGEISTINNNKNGEIKG